MTTRGRSELSRSSSVVTTSSRRSMPVRSSRSAGGAPSIMRAGRAGRPLRPRSRRRPECGGESAEHARQRDVGESDRAELDALAAARPRGVAERRPELIEQPRLADAGFAPDDGDVRPGLGGGREASVRSASSASRPIMTAVLVDAIRPSCHPPPARDPRRWHEAGRDVSARWRGCGRASRSTVTGALGAQRALGGDPGPLRARASSRSPTRRAVMR